MNNKKGILLALLLSNSLLLSGCVVTPLIELTDEENDLITNYSAKVVAKYNTYQKDGLNCTLPDPEQERATEEKKTDTKNEKEETEKNEQKSTETSDKKEIEEGNQSTQENQGTTSSVSLAKVIGHENELTITRTNTTTANSLSEKGVYSISAKQGMTYAVIHLKVTNNTGSNITLNNLMTKIDVTAKINGNTCQPMKSLLSNDFFTYTGTVTANSSIDMVMLYEIPSDAAAGVGGILLEATVDGTKSAVKL
ncbi:DUF4352 domain-containing protein [Lachnobacterium bovis]|uniref:DUF4352 domain-containing protein n=1 Tax=Lachnobacterium bovis TaxID=140626 RepID=UPI0003B33C8F|nr:hypothetical protein [Lachnobacterium bovis]